MSERKYAPRSGGRTAEQRSSTSTGARRYPTEGAAALKAEAAEPLRVPADRAEPNETRATPRLRVAPPMPISAPRAPFIAVVIAIVVAGVIGILLINTKTNENAFEISKLQDQKTGLDNQQQKLQNQIAGYESTGNLDAAARRLGLVKADTPAYIRLPDGRVIGVPKPGNGPTAVTAQDPAVTTKNGTTQNGTTQNGTTQNGTTQNGTTQNGTTQNGTTQNGSAQNGTGQNGSAQDGNANQGGAATGGTAGQNAGNQSAG
jgi:hypothetical protein